MVVQEGAVLVHVVPDRAVDLAVRKGKGDTHDHGDDPG